MAQNSFVAAQEGWFLSIGDGAQLQRANSHDRSARRSEHVYVSARALTWDDARLGSAKPLSFTIHVMVCGTSASRQIWENCVATV
jgi:hypothetical protein